MNWTTQRYPAERLMEWGVPALLAAAIGWATFSLNGTGLAGLGAAAVAMVAGVSAMRWTGAAEHGLTLADYAVEPIDESIRDELLLDDPLGEVAADSRVVSLFESEIDDEVATPGALVARIADYLDGRSPDTRSADDRGEERLPADAGAALHAALANIRASLR